ncbi:unnamed protein product [Paramecium sonneborni]|uniref:Transmembrane protein n=1 Tax=Paramecium sonneborni TaxID=65129 RepID=A0A8S1LBF9_9CILI|nr:unnamed protein product [Paramecium sonneborni]
MKYIKKLKLTFENENLEQQYQLVRKNQIQQQVFIFIIVLLFISNLVVIGFHFLNHKNETWYLNIAFGCLSIFLFILIVIMKKNQYLQEAITIANITLGFLELNVDPATTNYLEFYSYGNTFMQLQAALYIVSNFLHASIQVCFHFVLRMAITVIISQRTDYLLIFIGITSSFIILVTIYFKEKNSRKYFIQNLKENYWEKNTSFIIQKPYITINYHKEKLMFNLVKGNKIEQFPGYDNFYCEGCNVRKLLRFYQIDKNLTIEDYLLKKEVNISQKLLITYKKRKYLLKLCNVDIQQIQYLLILDNSNILSKQDENREIQYSNFIGFLKNNKNYNHQYFFNWGAQSLLFLNKKIIKKIELQDLMNKILKVFRIYIYKQISVKIITQNQNTSIFSFYYQTKIFMMQLFEIVSSIQRKDHSQIQMILKRKGCDIIIKIMNIDLQKFKQQFDQNFFLKSLKSLLLHKVEIQEDIYLHFRNYPIKSFAFNL